MGLKIGILALQGDYYKHGQAVTKLGYEPVFVKDNQTLNQCDKLIIPGGESTTFLYLIDKLELRPALLEFGREKAIMGTCAGLITLAAEVKQSPYKTLGLIDIKVNRNAYGRQIDSFIDTVELYFNDTPISFEGVFIRAPKIESCAPGIKKLGLHKNDTVVAANENILVTTFHPELTDDLRVHQYFIEKIGL